MIEQAKRKEIIDWVLEADDEMILLLEQLKEAEKSDWWQELTDEQRKKIEEGQKDIDDGRVVEHSEVKRKYGI